MCTKNMIGRLPLGRALLSKSSPPRFHSAAPGFPLRSLAPAAAQFAASATPPRAEELLKDLIDQQVQHLQKHQRNNDPFQERTVPVLQQIFKQFKILLDDLQTLPDIPVSFLKIKGPLQALVHPVQILILPGLRR